MWQRIARWWAAWGALVVLDGQSERMRADIGLGGLSPRQRRALVFGSDPGQEGLRQTAARGGAAVCGAGPGAVRRFEGLP